MSPASLPTDTASLYVQIYCNIFLYIYISLFIISFGHPFSPQTLPLFIFIFHFLQNTSDEQSKREDHAFIRPTLSHRNKWNKTSPKTETLAVKLRRKVDWRKTGNKKLRSNSCFQSVLLCALCTELFQVITYFVSQSTAHV